MSNNNTKYVNLEDAALIVCVFLLIVLFSGEPDIVDAIIHKLMS